MRQDSSWLLKYDEAQVPQVVSEAHVWQFEVQTVHSLLPVSMKVEV